MNLAVLDLVIFDIDGTLVRSKAADGECYAEAWREEFGVEGVSAETGDFRHSTDSGIAREIFLDRLGREATDGDIARLRTRFTSLLRERAEQNPEEFLEVPGAREALRRLRDHGDWAVAVATGSWRASATLKLRRAGIDVEGVPLVTSDDILMREDILKRTIERARKLHGREGFRRTVYVADGAWDVRAAARLDLAFLGVQDTRDAARLREAGAPAVIRDFSDFELFLEHLEGARVPAGGESR